MKKIVLFVFLIFFLTSFISIMLFISSFSPLQVREENSESIHDIANATNNQLLDKNITR